MRTACLLAVQAVMLIACSSRTPADLIVTGKIWTADAGKPIVEAMAVAGDSIVATGTLSDIESWRGSETRRIDAQPGQLIVPGFIDAHTHFVDGGFRLSSVQLRDAKTPEEFINRIKAFASKLPPGEWITGGDWDHENWGGTLPERQWIDSVTRNNPVWINRLDGHMALANSSALKIAGVDDKVKDIKGGAIVRNRKGQLTGILKDNAQSLVDEKLPESSLPQLMRALDTAMHYVASRGVTSVHNMSGYMDVFESANQQGKLITRIYAGMPLPQWRTLAERTRNRGNGDKWLRWGALKQFVDGSLGSHTAAFFQPFSDSPGDSGFFVTAPEVLYRDIKAADSAGLQVMTHAIGDKAIHTLLDIYERISKENGPRDRRFRIEHAQHIAPDDIARFRSLGVIASMQPYHAIDDGRWAEKVIGYERCKTTYAFKSLMDAGATVAFGSDWFVAPPTPLEGIYAAVTRRTLDDKNPDGWIPEQKITVEQALRAYTVNAAFASFEENIKGALAPGMLADFVVLDQDLLSIDAAEIRNVKVVQTVVGGKRVY